MAFGSYVYALKSSPTSSAAVTEELSFKYNDRPGKDIDEVWNPERAQALRQALPQARDEVDMLVLALDAYAARWLEVAAKPSATKDQFNWTNTCLADRLTALDDLVIAAGEGVRESAMLVGNAHEFLPDLADCEQSSQYNTLIAQGFAPTRRMSWRARLLMAGGFAPRVLHAARLPELGKGFEALGSAYLLGDARVNAEIELAGALLGFHDPSDEPNTYSYTDPRTGERIVHHERQLPPRTRTLKLLQGIAETSAAAGFADVAARAWAGVAELLEAGPHSEHARGRVGRPARGAGEAAGGAPAAAPAGRGPGDLRGRARAPRGARGHLRRARRHAAGVRGGAGGAGRLRHRAARRARSEPARVAAQAAGGAARVRRRRRRRGCVAPAERRRARRPQPAGARLPRLLGRRDRAAHAGHGREPALHLRPQPLRDRPGRAEG
ncbi:hypothetical protein [Nannocystis pusilla]|uniref:hypothetical protein n=1 Tax=Nannocystis pusilla TaxID=889268 RepID=UPI003B7AF6B9